MIISVTMQTVLDRDRTITHSTEVVVDSEEEARQRGAEFWQMMHAFNAGILEEAE